MTAKEILEHLNSNETSRAQLKTSLEDVLRLLIQFENLSETEMEAFWNRSDKKLPTKMAARSERP